LLRECLGQVKEVRWLTLLQLKLKLASPERPLFALDRGKICRHLNG
jgi:hypothetical protein